MFLILWHLIRGPIYVIAVFGVWVCIYWVWVDWLASRATDRRFVQRRKP